MRKAFKIDLISVMYFLNGPITNTTSTFCFLATSPSRNITTTSKKYYSSSKILRKAYMCVDTKNLSPKTT